MVEELLLKEVDQVEGAEMMIVGGAYMMVHQEAGERLLLVEEAHLGGQVDFPYILAAYYCLHVHL